MTVFVSHAPADLATAEGLEKVIERRGQFVELDDGQTALRPVTGADVVVLLLSKDFAFAPMRLRLEQRALDAWAEGRLILVKLDHAIAPVGLRDLPAIDASFEAQRELKWSELANEIAQKLKPAAPATAPAPAQKRPRLEYKVDRAQHHVEPPQRGAGWFGILLTLLLMLPGIGALVVSGAIWLANRIGPTPGTLADLVAGVDAFGTRYGAPAGVTPVVFALAIVLTLVAPIALILMRVACAGRRRKHQREVPEAYEDYEAAPAPVAGAAPASDVVFVSYASANAPVVMPILESVKQLGRKFWMDKQGLTAGDNWAGEIVRAIKGAPGVMVMCSAAAFESDHVKREVYLADRYKKRLVPIFIEEATPPEDFEYFFAGVQFLKLFETPEAERPEALNRALGTA